ncbi:hypothetical protein PMAYCL1PPCAC_01219, partial [Pristionchus mayeri]
FRTNALNLGNARQAAAVCGCLLVHLEPGTSGRLLRPTRARSRQRLLQHLPISRLSTAAEAKQRRSRQPPPQELLATQPIGRRRPKIERLRCTSIYRTPLATPFPPGNQPIDLTPYTYRTPSTPTPSVTVSSPQPLSINRSLRCDVGQQPKIDIE